MRTYPDLTRVAFGRGGPLLAADLRDALTHTSRLQALHVRGVHDTWGVASGFGLTLSADRRQVLVGPGAAFNCRADPLVLEQPAVVDGPPAGARVGAHDLLIGAAEVTDRPPAGCPRPLRTGFSWRAVGEKSVPCRCADHSDGRVPLARFALAVNGTLSEPDYAVRPVARGPSRPHIAIGTAPGGDLSWQYSSANWSAWVYTEAGGFAATPYYFAWLTELAPVPHLFVGPFVSVGDASQRRFKLRVGFVMPLRILLIGDLLSNLGDKLRAARIVWIGVEPERGCPLQLPQLSAPNGSPLGTLAAWMNALAGGNT